MADHNLPTITSTYSNFVTELDARLDDVTKWLASGTITNLPDGAVKWDTSALTWKKWATSNSTWGDLSTAYNININGTVGAASQFAGKFTDLSATGTAVSFPATATVGNAVIVSVSGTQTLTNKTLTSPVISTISNTGTITLPTTTDTLVGRDTTDTLTNKTLTTPKFANGGYIADPNGAALITFGATAAAVNGFKITNAATAGIPVLEVLGSDINISFNIKSKGTGVVQANGYTIADVNSIQTFSSKTLGSGSTWNGNTIGVVYGGTGTTTSPTAGGIAWGSSASAIGYTAAGTAGQVLKSNGTSAPSWVDATTLTAGYVTNGVYIGTDQTITGTKTFSAQVLVSSGTAVVPSIAFSADTGQDTGFYWIGDGSIGFASNGVKAGQIDAGGKLTMVGDIITVNGTIKGKYLEATTSFTSPTITSTGNISANGYLTVGVGASASSIYMNDSTSAESTRQIYCDNNKIGFLTTGLGWGSYCDNDGSWTSVAEVTAYSDARIKTNIERIPNALAKVGQLNGYTYDRTDVEMHRQTGVMAQEVLKVLPEAVRGSEDTVYTVAYGNLVGLLIEAINELNTKVDRLQEQLSYK
jgi:hypothetical protein